MNYLTAFSYIISHIFLILFFYLFMIADETAPAIT